MIRQANPVDFWRGMALVAIFVNHIPGIYYSRFTHASYSISDSADLFVFLAGWARKASEGLVGVAKRDGEWCAEVVTRYLNDKTPLGKSAAGDILKKLRQTLAERGAHPVDINSLRALESVEKSHKGHDEGAIGEFKIVQAAAARLAKGKVKKRTVLSSWQNVLEYCRTTMAFADKEQFRILFLDKRNQLIADGTLVQKNGFYEFTRDVQFTSPSAAAAVIEGGSANGLVSWKTKDGTTLKGLEEKQ